jgi:translation initiation factor 2 subunit 3
MTTTLRIHEADVIARQATHLVGTLGHVSEGKSTLVRALTGVRTQRHAAEQQRNITIHLGYANCKIWQNSVTGEVRALGTREAAPQSDTTGSSVWSLVAHLSFVDCPGHEAYLATMLGGAGVMDTACLIVASNQERIPQPQTLEHLIAAELTGLDRIAVIQNKCDLVDRAGAETAADKIRALVADTIAGSAPLFPVSAQHGWGVSRVLDWLLALPPPPRDLGAPARLTCVRSFDVNRPGPVVVGGAPLAGAVIGGPLEAGVLAVGDWLEVRPGLLKRGGAGGRAIVAQPLVTRVRGIRCENAELPVAVPGSLLAIATDLDPALSASNGMVGQRVGAPGSLPPIVGEITIRFRRLRREEYAFGRHHVGDRLRICSGVATTEGTLVERGESHVVRVRLDRPLCLGVGEQVSVLRRHEEAGRELLEGVGLVRAVEEWPDVAAAEGAELAVAPARTVEWVPIARSEFSAASGSIAYADLLADTMSHREELVDGGRLRLEEPRVERIPRHTVWVNWPAMYEALTCVDVSGAAAVSYHAHLREFLESELTTSSSENADGQLILRGTWRVDDLRGLLRRYVGAFKRCLQCRGYATGLVRVDGTLKVRCARCRCENVTGHTSAR